VTELAERPAGGTPSEGREEALRLENVHAYYGRIHALQGITIDVGRGEIVTLLGTNGAGKTTTLRTISGLMHPREGRVLLGGRDVSQVPAHALVSSGVAHAPEGRRIFSRLTVLENLQMGGYTRTRPEIAEDVDRVTTLFPRLKERIGQRGGTLSGGEQQMLAIGRALMTRPQILLLDEPSLGLAPILVQQIFEIIQEINGRGMTILLVEQNFRFAARIADRFYLMEHGKVLSGFPVGELAAHDAQLHEVLGV
jgi:branched-chain amino acid transport system ATP-binding protein